MATTLSQVHAAELARFSHACKPAQPGMRLIRRRSEFRWTHRLEMQADDLDCTDLDEAAFERVVRETEAQALVADRALNAAKATPAYYAPSDLFSLSQQNRGAL